MDGELLISLLEAAIDDDITADVETATDLAKDNAGVLLTTAGLELNKMTVELLITLLDTAADNEITEDDRTTADLADDTEIVL